MNRLLLLALATLCAAAHAQTVEAVPTSSPTPFVVWGEGAFGALARPLYMGGRAGVRVENSRYAAHLGFSSGDGLLDPASASSVALTAGLSRHWGLLNVSALVGPSVAWGTHTSRSDRYVAPGAAAEVAVLFTAGPHLLLGVEGHANVNRELSTIGVGPALRVKLGGRR